MEKIKVLINWCENNYSTSISDKGIGVIVATAKTLDGIKKEIAEALQQRIEWAVEDNENIEDWAKNGDYTLEFELDTSALLRSIEHKTTLKAIHKATGINENQLSHYFTGRKKARPEQRAKIIKGIHAIANELISIT
ncbi:MAG: CopG family transcriptional regulator [Prevotellaceae bacterium]|nr:CopG family transcriptional regulator [Prevotellaceae bacterium]